MLYHTPAQKQPWNAIAFVVVEKFSTNESDANKSQSNVFPSQVWDFDIKFDPDLSHVTFHPYLSSLF